MSGEPADEDASPDAEAHVAKRFESFAADYHRAFKGSGRQPLHALINALFRRRTFTKRTEVVTGWLREFRIAGRRVLDLGCGSGEIAIIAATLGASVTGLDIVPEMIEIARGEATKSGVLPAIDFRVGNLITAPVESADIVMMVGVIEYYKDLDLILKRAAGLASERLIIVDTRGPWWRRQLRFRLARLKHFHLYYHSPQRVEAVLSAEGFGRTHRVDGHSYTAFAFQRPSANPILTSP